MNESSSSIAPFVVIRDDAPPASLRGAVVAIGNFDGVHRGHRAVIDNALRIGRAHGWPAAAVTFEPHPRSYFRPHDPLFRLTDESTKLRLLAGAGLDGAFVMTFNAALATLSAEDFVARILVERFGVNGAVIGFDFHFGKDRRGSPAFLAAEGERRGFAVEIVAPLEDEGRPVSSTSIRSALAEGRVVEASELLGRPWFVHGTVEHGDKRGRTLGYPTANLRLPTSCGLKHGIYAVRVALDGTLYDGVASFGRRPTFDNGAPLLEVFLFDFAADLYGRALDVAFVGWIRPEMRFEDVDELIRRMDEDSRQARAILSRAPPWEPPPPL